MSKNKSKKIILIGIIGSVLMIASLARVYLIEQKEVCIDNNIYVNKILGVRLKFPVGWHSQLEKNKKSNILITLTKESFASGERYPSILVTGYKIDKSYKDEWSERADRILKGELRGRDYKIISKREFERNPYGAYEVIFELKNENNQSMKCGWFFIRSEDVLFCLWFADKIENFNTSKSFFEFAKNNFEIIK